MHRQDVEYRFGEKSGGSPPVVSTAPPPAQTADTPPVAVIEGTPSTRPRRSDAFDPNALPNAPGAPQPLGTTAPSAPLTRPPAGPPLELGRAPAAPTGPTIVNSGIAMVDAPREQFNTALQAFQSGQFKEAVELLRKAMMLDPRNGDLHRELGITFLMFHDWERARVEMLEAVHREPDNVDAHSGLAYALQKTGDLDGALKEYRLCRKMDPNDTSYQDHYVEVLGQLYSEKSQKKH